MTRICHIDFETFSHLDVRKVGAYRYAEDESTEVLICCYAVDDGQVETWLPRTQQMPRDLRLLVDEEDVLFCAHNAEFERQIWDKVLRRRSHGALPPVALARWRCTASMAAAAGLPRGLDGATAELGLAQRKDANGKTLIRFFCGPRKATKADEAVRNLPEQHVDKFRQFVQYCEQDVRAERALEKALPALSREELRNYHHNCVINDRGIPIDVPSVRATLRIVDELTKDMVDEAMVLTGGVRPTQRDKFLHWLHEEQGVTLNKLGAEDVSRALKRKVLPPKARRALELRSELGKAAPKKLTSMLAVVGQKDRVRGTLLYYGAHTGRLSGRLVQPHNFKRGLLKVDEYHTVLRAFRLGDAELIKMLYPDALDKLSQCMRGFIRAPWGMKFLVSDYTAIEARTLAWEADEQKVLRQYVSGVDTYKAMASVLYNVPIEEVTAEQRRIGKNLRLGAGYQLGPPKFVEHCANIGIVITQEFAEEAIGAYRRDNPNTVRFWYEIEDAAKQTVETGRPHSLRRIAFELWRDWLVMLLPSGRKIYYHKPRVDTAIKFGRPKRVLSYRGKTKKGSWGDVQTYGGKLTENATQSIARDILVHGMHRADAAEMSVVLNVHDEIVSLVPEDSPRTHHDLSTTITVMPSWAKGLPIGAEGFECEFYRKG